jgi:uncharacterized coiled-coil protein SlyX
MLATSLAACGCFASCARAFGSEAYALLVDAKPSRASEGEFLSEADAERRMRELEPLVQAVDDYIDEHSDDVDEEERWRKVMNRKLDEQRKVIDEQRKVMERICSKLYGESAPTSRPAAAGSAPPLAGRQPAPLTKTSGLSARLSVCAPLRLGSPRASGRTRD